MTGNCLIHDLLTKALRAGLNVVLEGRYGSGKSSLALAVTASLNLRLKYFSASTLDPFADLVGIPVPVIEGEKRRIVYLRPEPINSAEVLFFDELNRTHPKVLNAVFELVQFRSINGEKLPNLRCVIAAINPPGAGYHVQEMDPALMDRFHVRLRVTAGPDRAWFVNRFGPKTGHALLDWFETDLDEKQQASISNRRLEYLGLCASSGIDLQYGLPPEAKLPLHLLEARLHAEAMLNIEDFAGDPNRFSALVPQEPEVAIRFSQLLPMMNPRQLSRVKDIILALPADILGSVQAAAPFVFKKARAAVARFENEPDADAFWQLLQERLGKNGH